MIDDITSVAGTLWRHRTLCWQFTKRQVELRHKGSHLGLVWSLLSPLLMLALYVLVFGFIFSGHLGPNGATQSREEYALVAFLGLAIHHFVAEVITIGPTLVLSNPNFVKKVVFPLEILPLAAVGSAALHFCITIGLVFIGSLIAGVTFSLHLFWLPVLFGLLALFNLGLALALSAIGVYWRDIAQVAQFIVLALLFASAVFYPTSSIPESVWTFLRFNPLIHFIEDSRGALFWARSPSISHLTYLGAASLGSMSAGTIVFNRLRNTFADLL